MEKPTPARNARKLRTEGRRKRERRIRPGSHPNQGKKGEGKGKKEGRGKGSEEGGEKGEEGKRTKKGRGKGSEERGERAGTKAGAGVQPTQGGELLNR